VVQAGTTQVMVVVEPSVLLTGAGADVGGKPTTAELDGESSVDADVDEAGWWGGKDAPPSTLVEHYRMGMP
jgi:hypothetical protein